MSTDTDKRARAKQAFALASYIPLGHHDGWIEGHEAGQRDAQQASAEEIARLKGTHSMVNRNGDWFFTDGWDVVWRLTVTGDPSMPLQIVKHEVREGPP